MKKKKQNKKIKKEKPKLNHLGFPHDDPYGLAEAFWKIFTKPNGVKLLKKKLKSIVSAIQLMIHMD